MGTKASAHYQLIVGPGQSAVVRLRLTNTAPDTIDDPFGSSFAKTLAERQGEAELVLPLGNATRRR